jgi:hypothetical protein
MGCGAIEPKNKFVFSHTKKIVCVRFGYRTYSQVRYDAPSNKVNKDNGLIR